MGQRKVCPDCVKAMAACICGHIHTIDNPWELWILQHPKEACHPLGTARILSLSLKHSRLLIGEDFSEDHALNALMADRQRQCVLLYPGADAWMPDRLPATYRQPGKTVFLLLDGTWRKTHKMMLLSKNLQQLPRVALNPDTPTRYRVRKASRADSLSTVEAGYLLLSQLSGTERPYRSLIRSLDAMIDYQLTRMPPEVSLHHYGQRR